MCNKDMYSCSARDVYIYLPIAMTADKKLKSLTKSLEKVTPHPILDRFSFDGCLREMGILPSTPECQNNVKNVKIDDLVLC
jgi:hypothetical protein